MAVVPAISSFIWSSENKPWQRYSELTQETFAFKLLLNLIGNINSNNHPLLSIMEGKKKKKKKKKCQITFIKVRANLIIRYVIVGNQLIVWLILYAHNMLIML